ncbi:MAG: helix-turn-helix domain-containing protein [Pseudomonadales bacterium]|nr:helix-turn-helix domain-containing protein [Pseudomonadales bacterium]
MVENTNCCELGAYLRLHRAKPGEWAAALHSLTRGGETRLSAERAHLSGHCLAELSTRLGSVMYFWAEGGLRLSGRKGPWYTLALIQNGDVEMATDEGSLGPSPQLLMLPPDSPVDLSLQAGFRGLVIQLPPHLLTQIRMPTPVMQHGLRPWLEHYLFESQFFLDHGHAIAETERLLRRLLDALNEGVVAPAPPPRQLDRRVLRAIDKMRHDRNWEFQLADLASCAGVSERNLYYLMKAHTGMTPYRFHQRCRLIRVRQRLVDCQCATVHISRYASDEGFAHPGRFAALYREHFGELPRQTVQIRRALLERVAPLEALAG